MHEWILTSEGQTLAQLVAAQEALGNTVLQQDADNSRVLVDTPSGGFVGDTVSEAEIVLADNTTNNASTTKHGFLKKLSNVATEFMNGAGNWASLILPVKASGAEVDTGTDDAKFITALALTDSDYIKEADLPAGGITNSAGNNVVPKSDGTNLVASRITDGIVEGDNTYVNIGAPAGSGDAGIRVRPNAGSSQRYIDLDVPTGAVDMGDVGNVGNDTHLVIQDADSTISSSALTTRFIGNVGNVSLLIQDDVAADFVRAHTKTFEVINGDNNTLLRVAAAAEQITMEAAVSITATSIGTVGIGDTTNAAGSQLRIDAAGGLFDALTTGVFGAGDVDDEGNSTKLVISDTAQTISLTAANGININSVAKLAPLAFASLPASPAEGMMAWVNDSNTAVWGATIAGGGTDKVLAVFNGTVWTVAGK